MITYNNKELTEGVKVLEIKRPLLPPQLNSFIGLDDRNGSFHYNKKSDVLTIDIEVLITAKTNEKLRENMRGFAEMLHVDSPKELIFHDEPDKYVKAIVDGGTQLDNFFRVGKGTITMLVPDPFYYAVNDDIYTYTDEVEHSFTKKGNATSHPTIEIDGVNDGGTITVNVNGKIIEYTGDLSKGETLVYNTDLLTGYVEEAGGSKRSAIPYMSTLDLPVLSNGNNTIKIETSSGAELYSYKIRCNSRWL